jgi:hypothetical protein
LSKTKKNPNIMPSLVNLAPTFIIYHGHLYFIHREKNYVTVVITAWSHRLLVDQENTDSRASDHKLLSPGRYELLLAWQQKKKLQRALWFQQNYQEVMNAGYCTRIEVYLLQNKDTRDPVDHWSHWHICRDLQHL